MLVKNYVTALGFKYISAFSKEEFISVADEFVTSENLDKPMVLEVFTDSKDESDAIRLMRTLVKDNRSLTKKIKDKTSSVIRKIIR